MPRLPGARQAATRSLLICSATLVCCALPALLVLLGAGSVLASLLTWWPGLVLLSQRKTLVFSLAGLTLLLAGTALWRSAHLPCPREPSAARRCRRHLRQARWLYGIACGPYLIGFMSAVVLPRMLAG
jgi:hypothetical protein